VPREGTPVNAIRLRVDDETRGHIDRLVHGLMREGVRLDHEADIVRVGRAAQSAPRWLRAHLQAFRIDDADCLLVDRFAIDDGSIGLTPRSWADVPVATREDVLLVMLGFLLGEPFAWATQQGGRLVNNVLPMREHENEQVGFSSRCEVTLHTEDAFQELRPEFVCLLCLRNPDRIPTTVAAVSDVELDAAQMEALSREVFQIVPDEAHTRAKNESTGADFDAIGAMRENPTSCAILYGDPGHECLRFDPYYTLPPPDEDSRSAMEALAASLRQAAVPIALEPGQLCLLNNRRVVHGRPAFGPRYDGGDRWLKRICVAGDLPQAEGSDPGRPRVFGQVPR
jgi:Fe(II)/alpha-ketoglutarate-dependent arginine beta-hydroxylase